MSAMKSRDLLAIQPNQVTRKMMQQMLQCAIYTGTLSKASKL